MNQKGWGFKDFIIILGVIFFTVIITFLIYKVSFNKSGRVTKSVETVEKKKLYDTYDELEYQLKRAAERYQNDNYQGVMESEETWILSYSLLYKEGYLKHKLYDIEDASIECDGYVRFLKKGASISYTPYIKCGNNYSTEGYNLNSVTS